MQRLSVHSVRFLSDLRQLHNNNQCICVHTLYSTVQGKLFQRCTHLLCCHWAVMQTNTRRMSKPDMRSIFHIKNRWNTLVIGNYYVKYQNYQNSMLLTSTNTKRTLMHLFLFTNSAQRELVSIFTQSIHDRNKLSLQPYILEYKRVFQTMIGYKREYLLELMIQSWDWD